MLDDIRKIQKPDKKCILIYYVKYTVIFDYKNYLQNKSL